MELLSEKEGVVAKRTLTLTEKVAQVLEKGRVELAPLGVEQLNKPPPYAKLDDLKGLLLQQQLLHMVESENVEESSQKIEEIFNDMKAEINVILNSEISRFVNKLENELGFPKQVINKLIPLEINQFLGN